MSKLSLPGKESSSKLSRWVEPSFGEEFISSSSSSKGRKPRPPGAGGGARKTRTTTTVGGDGGGGVGEHGDLPWVDLYAPNSQADLAVHKKKIEEVETWMRTHLNVRTSKSSVLLLSGPSGCGKSATVQVLCRELGFTRQEWTNPTSGPSAPWSDSQTGSHSQTWSQNQTGSQSQTAQFQDFLLRANKYKRLQMAGESSAAERTIILVEDFPNQFYRQPVSLHHILRRFVHTSRSPLVFILSDSLSGDSSSRLMFPKDLQEELNICHISFNPVAPTSLMKVLTRIATQEAAKGQGGSRRKLVVPDRAALELLCSGSSGDIRSAINSLQFSSFTDSSVERAGPWAGPRASSKKGVAVSSGRAPPRGKRKSKDSKEQNVEQAIGGKDASLFLFRALGKILYCKRETPGDCEGPVLPDHLSEHHRDRLLEDPEVVVERSHMSAEFFNLYLHQNYLEFFSEVEDVERASEYLSDADFLTGEWANRSTLGLYGSSVATRGLLHSNRGQAAPGFRPLHKPSWLTISKKHRENCLAAQSLFANFCVPPVSLQTEVLPYLSMLNTPLRNTAQITFIQDVGRFPRQVFPGRFKSEALTDKDPGLLEEEEEGVPEGVHEGVHEGGPGGSDSLPASQPQPAMTEDLEEDHLLIEEYDTD